MDVAVPNNKLKCPISIQWSIPEKRLKELKCLYSVIFDVPNIPVQYFLSINPNIVEREEAETWIFLYLETFRKVVKFEAKFNIKIESANYISLGESTFEGRRYWGTPCCTRDELFDPEKKFIVDGKLIIKMDGFLMIEKTDENEKLWECENISDTLCLALWKQDENKDFTIFVDGKTIAVHKCVLAARSLVFSRMLESGMKEAKENKVSIKDFTYNVVEKAIKLCYHQSLVSHSTLDDKLKLLQFFDKYNIEQLKDSLQNYLSSVINELTVCRITNAALLSNASKLKMKCAEFLRVCMKTKPISDIDLLDKDFALDLFKNSFSHISD